MVATMQQQAKALGDPTRHAIFRYVAAAAHPVGVAELTDHLGFNHNAIRQHLAKLVAAGLLTEGKAFRSGPGRPRLVYAVDPTAESRWGVTGPYERLTWLLAEVIRTGDTPREVGRRAGRAMRGEGTDATSVVEQVCEAMARQGFEPEVQHRGPSTDVLLRSCPFESTAVADPTTVCQLHLGLAEGLVEGTAEVEVGQLVAKDPRRADCLLELRITAPARA